MRPEQIMVTVSGWDELHFINQYYCKLFKLFNHTYYGYIQFLGFRDHYGLEKDRWV